MIVTSGRTDIQDYFAKSCCLLEFNGGIKKTKLTHCPFLVFIENNNAIEVKIVDKVNDLLLFSDNTKVMSQWRGQYSSDFFQYTIGDVRQFILQNT
jgi:hypothetical protein